MCTNSSHIFRHSHFPVSAPPMNFLCVCTQRPVRTIYMIANDRQYPALKTAYLAYMRTSKPMVTMSHQTQRHRASASSNSMLQILPSPFTYIVRQTYMYTMAAARAAGRDHPELNPTDCHCSGNAARAPVLTQVSSNCTHRGRVPLCGLC